MYPGKRSWQAMLTLFLALALVATSFPAQVRAQDPPEPTSHRDPMPLCLADILNPLGGACDTPWAYDAWDEADPWKQLPGDLAQVDETMGGWLHLTQPAILPVTGRHPVSTTIGLRAGWNLVGYSAQSARSVAEALAPIDGCYTQVQTWDSTEPGNPWNQYDVDVPAYANDLAMMEPGRGYWIYATTPCTPSIAP